MLRYALLLAGCLAAVPMALAQGADDGYAWLNACMADSMKKGASDDAAHSYCACIDNEMGDAEVNDRSAWEKANPGPAEECREIAGWK
jgi:hypothetical protein